MTTNMELETSATPTPPGFFAKHSKTLKVSAIIASLFIIGKILTRNYSIFGKLLNVSQILIAVSILILAGYILSREMFGTVIIVNRKEWTTKFKLVRDTPGTVFLMFLYYLFDWSVTGFKDYDAFREKLANNTSPLIRSDVFAVFSAFCCYRFGLLNLIFPLVFWWLTTKQFEEDHDAAVHVTSCEILIGVVFALFLTVKFAPIYILYVIFSIAWVVKHFNRSYAFLVLHLSKLAVFTASLLLPYFLSPILHKILPF